MKAQPDVHAEVKFSLFMCLCVSVSKRNENGNDNEAMFLSKFFLSISIMGSDAHFRP